MPQKSILLSMFWFGIFCLAFFGNARLARAVIMIPFSSIIINEHAVGGDDSFSFHISGQDFGDPFYSISDFNIQTANGAGSYMENIPVWGSSVF